MNKPLKKNSAVLNEFRESKDLKESKKTKKRMLLAAKIIMALKEKGWSKLYFAEKMGKQPSVITRWLSGTHNFTTEILYDIEEILCIELFNLKRGMDSIAGNSISAITPTSPKCVYVVDRGLPLINPQYYTYSTKGNSKPTTIEVYN